MWKGRKSAFAAMGRLAPNYIVQDGVIPRKDIARVLAEIARLSRERGPPGGERLPRRRRQPAPAGALRRQACPARSTPPRSSPARSSGSASATAARSPASTAWAPTRRPYMAEMFSERRPRHHGQGALRVRPRDDLQPEQGVPHARGSAVTARGLPPARHRAGRARGPRMTAAAGQPRRAGHGPSGAPGDAGRGGGGRSAARRAGRARVLFLGGGTELSLGAPPDGVEVVLGTERLERIVEHAPAGPDRHRRGRRPARVAPGQPSRRSGQMLALDPPLGRTGRPSAGWSRRTPSAPGGRATEASATSSSACPSSAPTGPWRAAAARW